MDKFDKIAVGNVCSTKKKVFSGDDHNCNIYIWYRCFQPLGIPKYLTNG